MPTKRATNKQTRKQRRNRRKTQKGGSKAITAILLTTTVHTQPKETLHQTDKQQRITTYLKSVKQWLEKTKLPIVVVENSGYNFDAELKAEKEKYKTRFEVVAFNEASLPEAAYLKGNTSKGASEIYAIDYAYHHSKLLEKADFIVKITGRYYVPTLESYLNNQTILNYNALRQNNPTSCELLGASHKVFPKIFNPYLINREGKYDGHVESIYKYRIDLLPPAKVLHAPKFNIEPTLRGGHKQIMVHL
jgi:hypothetical protein